MNVDYNKITAMEYKDKVAIVTGGAHGMGTFYQRMSKDGKVVELVMLHNDTVKNAIGKLEGAISGLETLLASI